jgi:hypothetical protein
MAAKPKTLSIMKQFIILAVGLFSFAATTQATPVNTLSVPAVNSIPVENISSISVSDGITVILTENSSGNITATGEDKYLSLVEYSISKGEIRIKSKKGSLKNKVTVTVPVRNLRVLEVNDDSEVKNTGCLESNLLNVIINGYGRVHLYNKGKIEFKSDADIDLMVKKSAPVPASN